MSSTGKKVEEGAPGDDHPKNNSGSSHLAIFPQELLTLTVQNLNKRDLKSARLTSKHLCRSATPVLFKDWTIFAHQRSFDTLHQVDAASQIAQSVVSLTYNARFAHTTECLLAVLGKALLDQGYSRDDHKRIIEPARSLDIGAFTSGSRADDAVLTVLITQAFKKLTHVKKLTIIASGERPRQNGDEDDNHEAEVPSFYQKLWSEAMSRFTKDSAEYVFLHDAWADNYPDPHAPCEISVLTAACALDTPLNSLQIDGLDWAKMFDGSPMYKSPRLYIRTFSGLTRLQLTSRNSLDMGKYIVDLQIMLRLAIGLEELVLHLAYGRWSMASWEVIEHLRNSNSISTFQPQGVPIPARLTWSPRLQYFDLRNIACTHSEMTSVLEHCSPTLKVLKLRDILLTSASGTAKPCVVKLIKHIQQTLKLDSFEPSGTFSNTGMQDWDLGPEVWHERGWVQRRKLPPGQGMRDRVQEFVLEGGECPLDFLAIPEGHYDLGRKHREDYAPWAFRGTDFQGDTTWEMNYADENFSQEDLDEHEFDNLDTDLDIDFGLGGSRRVGDTIYSDDADSPLAELDSENVRAAEEVYEAECKRTKLERRAMQEQGEEMAVEPQDSTSDAA